jgi:hypothetical protein
VVLALLRAGDVPEGDAGVGLDAGASARKRAWSRSSDDMIDRGAASME